MNFLRTALLLILVSCVFGLISPAMGAKQQTADEIESLLKDEKSELNKLKEKIARREKEIKAMGKKQSTVLKTLAQLDDRLKLRERELKIYHWNIEINKKKIGRLEKSLNETRMSFEKQKQVLGARLRTIYKEGGNFAIKALFASESFPDLVQRFRYMGTVMAYDSAIFQTYSNKLVQLNHEKEALLKVKDNLFMLEESAQKKKKELEEEKSQKRTFLSKIKSRKALKVQTHKELLNARQNLNSLISRLQEKLVLGKGLSIMDKKGRLSMPVSGKIISRFGRYRDKKYGTYIVNNGIDIKAPKGTPIRSIFHGKVLYTGLLEGYGSLIIIGHGDNIHSLYGHLDKIRVKTGQLVGEGDIIGLSGDSGSLIGDSLYLELRQKGKPVKPKPWFKLAKR